MGVKVAQNTPPRELTYYNSSLSVRHASWNYFILVFTLLFGVTFYDVIHNALNFSYTDELIALTLAFYWVMCRHRKLKEFRYFFFIALFYLVYSLAFPHNVRPAIFTDFFIQIKPYIAFYTVYALNFSVTPRQERNIRRLCKLLSFYMLVVGIIYVAGYEQIMYDTFGHPSRFATAATISGVMYLIYSKQGRREIFHSIIMVGIGVLSARSKAYGFFAAYALFFLYRGRINTKRLLTFKNLVIAAVLAVAVVAMAWTKVKFYFITGTEYGQMPYARPLLYIEALDILLDYPFFGVGLGSYAVHASAVWYSPIYSAYDLDMSSEIGNGLFISDTFFPVFAEFGFVGLLLYIIFWKNRLKTAKANFLITQNSVYFKLAILVVIFFFIENIADSTFTHNRGMAMLMLYAIVLNNKYRPLTSHDSH